MSSAVSSRQLPRRTARLYRCYDCRRMFHKRWSDWCDEKVEAAYVCEECYQKASSVPQDGTVDD